MDIKKHKVLEALYRICTRVDSMTEASEESTQLVCDIGDVMTEVEKLIDNAKEQYPTPRRCQDCENEGRVDDDGWTNCKKFDVRIGGNPHHCDMFKGK